MNKDLKPEFTRLRKEKINFITVSNGEWYSLLKDEIRNSIAIEGVFAKRNELLAVLERRKRTSDEKTSAILGYFDAASSVYEYANNLFLEGEFQLRLADIRQIHTLLLRYEKQIRTFNGDLGEFRKENVAVTQSTFAPRKGERIHEVIQVYIEWINQKLTTRNYDWIELAAASHILFEIIHPFSDGNGRCGRILLSYLLIGCGYINIAIKGTNKTDRDTYYAALEAGDNQFNEMLRAIERGRRASVKMIDDFARQSDLSRMNAIIYDRLKNALKRLQQKEPVAFDRDAELSLKDAAQFFNYSQDYLRNLINNGKIVGHKKGKLWYVTIREIEKYIDRQQTLFD